MWVGWIVEFRAAGHVAGVFFVDEKSRNGELPGSGHGVLWDGLMEAANCWKRFLKFWISSWGPAKRGVCSLGPGDELRRVGEMELVR